MSIYKGNTLVTGNTLPSQSGQSGKFLTTDGSTASWGSVEALPSQSGQSGKYLTTDGSTASWGTINVPEKISDLTDDTSTNPIDKADTLTGLTATVSELNVLDGIIATTAELNYTDGVTSNIQTQLNGKQATLTAGTNINITNNTISATDTTYSAGSGLTLTGTQFSANIVDNVTSTDTDKSLSANMGKELQDEISNLKARGRYLSTWNCTTGLAGTTPTTLPYTYKTGDYFIVSTVGSTNYKPNGSTYTGTASSTVESGSVAVNDTYYYDGSVWSLLHGADVQVTFSSIAGQPTDNSNLASALNAKQATLVSGTNIKTINNTSLLGSGNIEIQATPDDETISLNSSDELQAIGVIDSRDSSTALKYWTGTSAQYEAITTKDSNTLYNITDDTDITLTLLQTIYPVGSIYITTNSTCPLASLFGTWTLVGADRVLQGAGTRGSVGTTLSESLPKVTGTISTVGNHSHAQYVTANAGTGGTGIRQDWNLDSTGFTAYSQGINTGAAGSHSHTFTQSNSSTYQTDAPVQPDAYLVNIWRRVS